MAVDDCFYPVKQTGSALLPSKPHQAVCWCSLCSCQRVSLLSENKEVKLSWQVGTPCSASRLSAAEGIFSSDWISCFNKSISILTSWAARAAAFLVQLHLLSCCHSLHEVSANSVLGFILFLLLLKWHNELINKTNKLSSSKIQLYSSLCAWWPGDLRSNATLSKEKVI